MKRKHRMEFSKKIFVFVSILTTSVIIFSYVLMWKTSDTSPLIYLIPGIFGVFGTSVGFYYKKAELENKIKLEKHYQIELDNTSDTYEPEQDDTPNITIL